VGKSETVKEKNSVDICANKSRKSTTFYRKIPFIERVDAIYNCILI